MLNIHEVESTIEEMKQKGKTMDAAEKLAVLYYLRDQMVKEATQTEEKHTPVRASSSTAAPQSEADMSEFKAACLRAPAEVVIDVMDKHMEGLRVVYPKAYNRVMRMLSES